MQFFLSLPVCLSVCLSSKELCVEGATTLAIMTLSLTTFSTMNVSLVTYNNATIIIVSMLSAYIQACHYADWHAPVELHYVGYQYTGFHFAEVLYATCMQLDIMLSCIMLTVMILRVIMLCFIMLVIIILSMLSIIKVCVILANVIKQVPLSWLSLFLNVIQSIVNCLFAYAECQYAEPRYLFVNILSVPL